MDLRYASCFAEAAKSSKFMGRGSSPTSMVIKSCLADLPERQACVLSLACQAGS